MQQNRGTGAPGGTAHDAGSGASGASDGLSGSGSGSGSEGDEVEFVPSSWDCRAEPGKSSLRSLEQHPVTIQYDTLLLNCVVCDVCWTYDLRPYTERTELVRK